MEAGIGNAQRTLGKGNECTRTRHRDQKKCPYETSKESISGSTDGCASRTDVNVYGRVFKDVVILGKDSYFNREAADAYYHVALYRRARWPYIMVGKVVGILHINGFEFVERPKYDFEDHATFLEGKSLQGSKTW